MVVSQRKDVRNKQSVIRPLFGEAAPSVSDDQVTGEPANQAVSDEPEWCGFWNRYGFSYKLAD